MSELTVPAHGASLPPEVALGLLDAPTSSPTIPAMKAVWTALVALTTAITMPAHALAFGDDLGSRGLGMGGAGRADARGDQALAMNPSGMSLARLYTIQSHYQYVTRDGGHLGQVSIVDSTSAFNLAGGVYYTYRKASPAGIPSLSGHEGGVALSMPLGPYLMIGATGKYLRLSTGWLEPNGTEPRGGFTADAGLTIRPTAILTLAVVGYNLRDLSTRQAPVGLGYGASLIPVPEVSFAVDLFHDFTTSDPTRGTRLSIAVGSEYTMSQRLAVRLGGGREGVLQHGYVSGGVAALSEMGALDFSFRQDVSGQAKQTVAVVAVRLFVPQP